MFDKSISYTIGQRDIDSNHHVNNLSYLDFAYETLPIEYFKKEFSQVEIMYKKECTLGETIKCLYTKISDKEYVITIKSEDLKELLCIIKLKNDI